MRQKDKGSGFKVKRKGDFAPIGKYLKGRRTKNKPSTFFL
jgi:hypothetical protein